MDAFEKLEKVGEGTYGKVYSARENATGRIVAFKKTRLHKDEEGVPPTTLCEISILLMLSKDPHIVKLIDVKHGVNKEGKTVLYLVLEYTDTDLKKYICSFRAIRSNIPSDTVKSLMYQLCKGVACFLPWKGSITQQMLRFEPSKRISAKADMEHPYFNGLNKAGL